MATMRLDKLLCDLGLGSRREVRDWIRAGRVSIDGTPVRSPELKLDPASCSVSLDGKALRYQADHYYMMDKPVGVITATEDPAQKTVLDLLPPELQRLGLFPVGRLDKDTSGLLILTNDGDYSHRVTAPKVGVEKRYLAEVDGIPDADDVSAFAAGLILGDGTKCLPAGLECLGGGRCIVTVQEGKYHQVKRMLASRGKPVLSLRRLSIGALELDDTLGPGGIRELDPQELCTVFLDRKPKTKA